MNDINNMRELREELGVFYYNKFLVLPMKSIELFENSLRLVVNAFL